MTADEVAAGGGALLSSGTFQLFVTYCRRCRDGRQHRWSQVLPTVMGADVFVMAELPRMPYTDILVAASCPPCCSPSYEKEPT